MPHCSDPPVLFSKLKFSCDKYSVDKVLTKIYGHFYFRGITLTEAASMPTNTDSTFNWQAIYSAYAIVMFLILLVGFFGNLFTIIVLLQSEHRRKSITPLMMNIAIADLLIIVFGYPVVISTNLNGKLMYTGSGYCNWSGFVNGMTGLTSIASLTAMSGVVYQTVKRNSPNSYGSNRQSIILIAGSWTYGFITVLPPLVGWNRFVPGVAGFSCAPDWTAPDNASLGYTILLVTLGFFLPLMFIVIFHILTYR